MAKNRRIYFAVTNELCFDQRMHRICQSLANHGYAITLIGWNLKGSPELPKGFDFKMVRIRCFISTGKFRYLEYNIKLLLYLLFHGLDGICAIDLDTIIPCLLASKIKSVPRIYDAHELFCEMKEVVTRPMIYNFWKWVERKTVPAFKNGYTVCQPIADEFFHMYGVKYSIIRNVPLLTTLENTIPSGKFLLYQGAVNEGRGFENLIPVMRYINAKLIICGDGNFLLKAKDLVKELRLEDKVEFKGMVNPADLKNITKQAYIGITLFDSFGRSNYYSLANRFFDYMHAGIPQICMNYPSYQQIVSQFKFALLVDDLEPQTLTQAINNLLVNDVLYQELKINCLKARQVINWQQEEKTLVQFYQQLFR